MKRDMFSAHTLVLAIEGKHPELSISIFVFVAQMIPSIVD
jgi:hypothetical protein